MNSYTESDTILKISVEWFLKKGSLNVLYVLHKIRFTEPGPLYVLLDRVFVNSVVLCG